MGRRPGGRPAKTESEKVDGEGEKQRRVEANLSGGQGCTRAVASYGKVR